MSKSFLIALLLTCLCNVSHAFFMFEPFVGYNRGQEQASRTQGIGLGARLGVDIKDIFIAADIGYHDTQQGSLPSVKYNDTGVTIGGQLQKIRLWYGLISSSQFQYNSSGTMITYKGSGTKYGLGTELSGKLQLNLELKTLDFTTSENAGTISQIAEIATIGFISFSWLL